MFEDIVKENKDLRDFIVNFLVNIPPINSGDAEIDSGYNMCLNEVYKLVSAFYEVKYYDTVKEAGIDIRKLQGIMLN